MLHVDIIANKKHLKRSAFYAMCKELVWGYVLRLISHRNFRCYPNIVILTFVGNLVVLFKVFASFKVIGDFPANFTHLFITLRTIHELSITD
jgi:uncharacterized protein HemY